MTLENQILSAVIQDHKERTVLGTTSFGDIFFKEDDGQGGQLYLVCQIITRQGVPSNPNARGKFDFEVKPLTQLKKTAAHLISPKLSTPFKILTSRALHEVYDEINLRFGLKEELDKKLGKLQKDEFFGHCYADGDNSPNKFAVRVQKRLYFEEVLEYVSDFPSIYYDDIYELGLENEFGPLVQKVYLGYGFEIPEQIYNYINLKALAIYNQSVKELLPEKLLRFKNLNSLSLDNVRSLPQEILDVVHQIPYLVQLSLSTTDGFADRKSFTRIPMHLNTLKSLRYFSFAGNALSDWSEVVKLRNLRSLDLSSCGLTSISEEIGQLNLLEELNLSDNRIKHLPEAISGLKNLKVLRLNGNQLLEIPEWIAQVKNLQLLDLAQSGLKTLPETIAGLPMLSELVLKKNPFESLPASLLKIPKRILQIEIRNQALYDAKAKRKMASYPKGNVKFDNDFNFKLMVINQLMYVDKVLLPKFNIYEFAKNFQDRKIDIEAEGYDPIPEAIFYFENLEISMDLLIDIKELKPDGGDEIYRQIIPYWHGEDDGFAVRSVADVKHLPNLKATNTMNFSKELIRELRGMKIKVSNY